MNTEDIPALVRELRRRLDLTQEQFARHVGVTCSTVNTWENGRRAPQPFLVARLLDLKAGLDEGRGSPVENVPRRSGAGAAPGSPDEGDVRSQIRRMVERIVERFHPQTIILFGSHARGDARPGSDVDLLVVMPVEGSKRAAQLEVRRALRDIRVPKDVIVTTPEEFEWRRRVAGTVERPASEEGRVLYAVG
jgi:predicted nucleotidyltransferase/DNA-binding XRE family transcriptional regulator